MRKLSLGKVKIQITALQKVTELDFYTAIETRGGPLNPCAILPSPLIEIYRLEKKEIGVRRLAQKQVEI